MKIKYIVITILAIFFCIWFLWGLVVSTISNSKCRAECINQNALTYEWNAGGGYWIQDDVCICIFKDKIKSFKVGEING